MRAEKRSALSRGASWMGTQIASAILKHFISGILVMAGPTVVAVVWAQFEITRKASPGVFAIALLAGAVSVPLLVRKRRAERFFYSILVGRRSGIRRVFPVLKYDGDPSEANIRQRDVAEESIRSLVTNSTKVRLLLASGFHYIGWKDNPGILFDVLRSKRPGTILEVLIINPDKAADRAKDVGLTLEQYREGTFAVLATLASFRNDGISIEVKVYDEEPIWQMVINDSEMWLLCARKTRSECSPIYCLLRGAEYGLHHGLYGVWERRWNKALQVDLDRLPTPDKNKIRDVRQNVK
jgi:hypothetical protein